MTLAEEFGSGQVLWSMFYFFLFFIWIYLLIIVFSDIFRSDDLGGWAKALWVIFVIVPALPRRVRLPHFRGQQDEWHTSQAAQAQDDARRPTSRRGRLGGRARPTNSLVWRISKKRASSPTPSSPSSRRRHFPDRTCAPRDIVA